MSQFLKNLSDCEEESVELRRGPWTVDEDFTLINYIASHGEGRWNTLARCSGLKRTGKSCRLRWLNYLRPDVRRGNITLQEQLLILELHWRWGNRWSKIAQYLPGRTDNEIKNYWRTRVQKQAKQLKCDVNSKQVKDTMRYLWMPRLGERIQSAAAGTSSRSITGISSRKGNTSSESPGTDCCRKLYPVESEILNRDSCYPASQDGDPPLTESTSYLIHGLESTDPKGPSMDGGDGWDHLWVGDDEMWSLQVTTTASPPECVRRLRLGNKVMATEHRCTLQDS